MCQYIYIYIYMGYIRAAKVGGCAHHTCDMTHSYVWCVYKCVYMHIDVYRYYGWTYTCIYVYM